MNCRKALAELAEGATRSDPSLATHLDDCPACREAAALATALDRSGDELRRFDLSSDVIRETRRQAAEILAAREQRAPARRVIRIPGPALGWAASAAVLVVAAVGYFRSQVETAVPPPPAELSAETTIALDAQIADLSTRVQTGMKDFGKRYGFEKRSIVETERERLRNRIKLSERILRDHLGDADGSTEVYRGGV